MFRVEPASDSVAILRMDDGKVNIMSPAFLRAFPGAFTQAGADGERAVVIAGNARAFCAGLDLKTLPSLGRETVGFAQDLLRAFQLVWDHPRPVVAAVDGPAIAGGAFLALCADLRVVGGHARIGVTEVPVGVPFPPPLVDLLRATLPPQELGPAALQGVVRAGEACVTHGWAHRVSRAPVDDAVRLADELASHSALAFRLSKAALRREVSESLAKFDATVWARELEHPDTKAALARTLEKLAKR